MAAVTFDAPSPGAGAFRQLFANGSSKIVTGTFAFDASYPTGGESITDITGRFKVCKGCIFETDGVRLYKADLTNNKVLAYSALNTQVANTTDLSAVTGIRFIAWGD